MVLSRAKRTPTTSIRFRNKLNIYIHYMEAYRSGHNGPHSKCGYRPKRYKGSNPFASASSAHPSKVAQPNKRLDKDSHAFFLLVALPDGIRCTSTASGRRNDVAFRFTALTAERLVGRIPSLPPVPRTRQRLRNQIKGLTKTVMPFFCWLLYPTGYAARLQLREDEMT